MDPQTNHQTNHQFRRLPKGERRVRFADSMGMELVSIFLFDLISNYYFASIHNHKQLPPPPTSKKILNYKQSLPPPITKTNDNLKQPPSQPSTILAERSTSSTKNIHNNNKNINNNSSNQNHNQLHNNPSPTNDWFCEFTQPISLVSFKPRVKLNKVHLETCQVTSRAGNISVSCLIRVLNSSYDKSVIVRYTTDEWHTFTDSLASYKPGSNDGWSDQFTSTFSVTNQVKSFKTGQRIIFAIRYTFGGDKVHWDNNGGLNYTLQKI